VHKPPDVAHAPAVPVVTAILAVLAAIGSMVSNRTSSEALAVKNQAILIRTDASDAYNSFEAHEIREHIYEAASLENRTAGAGTRERLDLVAASEKGLAQPFLEKARRNELQSRAASERSEGLAHAHDLYDAAIALVEIAIAIISISALASSWYLVGLAGVSAVAGIVTFIVGASGSP
jgi:hypothetical protein